MYAEGVEGDMFREATEVSLAALEQMRNQIYYYEKKIDEGERLISVLKDGIESRDKGIAQRDEIIKKLLAIMPAPTDEE